MPAAPVITIAARRGGVVCPGALKPTDRARRKHQLVESGWSSWSAAMIFQAVIGVARETPVAL